MAVVNGEPGFTQDTKLNVIEKLLVQGVELVSLGGPVLIDGTSQATDQQPSAVDTPRVIEFGPAQGTSEDPIQLLANGDMVVNKAGTYFFDFYFQIGRTGAAGVSKIFGRLTVNNVQPATGDSVLALLDNADIIIPQEIETTIPLNQGDVVRIEIIRDSSGNNSGGLFADTPTPAGWNPAPSATVQIREVIGGS